MREKIRDQGGGTLYEWRSLQEVRVSGSYRKIMAGALAERDESPEQPA
jgi:hypothetical protein